MARENGHSRELRFECPCCDGWLLTRALHRDRSIRTVSARVYELIYFDEFVGGIHDTSEWLNTPRRADDGNDRWSEKEECAPSGPHSGLERVSSCENESPPWRIEFVPKAPVRIGGVAGDEETPHGTMGYVVQTA